MKKELTQSYIAIVESEKGSFITHYESKLRSKRQKIESTFDDAFYTLVVNNDPLTYFEIVSLNDSTIWIKAIKSEINFLNHNGAYELMDLLAGAKPISCKWTFKKKYRLDGFIDKYKVRLVV